MVFRGRGGGGFHPPYGEAPGRSEFLADQAAEVMEGDADPVVIDIFIIESHTHTMERRVRAVQFAL